MNEINKRQKQSILFTVMLIISTIVVITSVIFTFVLIEYRTKDLIEKSDDTLFMAAELTREIIGSNYHDKINNESSVTNEQFKKIVAKNDDLCRRLNLQYLWSVLVIGDRIVFTSATHSDLTNPQSPCAAFFETHSDPDAFSTAIHSGLKPSFSTFKNQWRKGRMVLIPRKDARGRTYIFGASVQLTKFNEIVYRSIITSIGIGLAVILCGLALALILARLITLPITKLTEAANIMATGNLGIAMEPTRIRELQSLSTSLDQMRQGIQNHLSALRESEAQLRAILNATPFPIALVDVQDNNIVFWSRSALKLFGHIAPTAPDWYQIAYPDPDYRSDVIDRWKPFLEIARESRQTVNTGEYRVTCSDGSVRICELYATFLADILIVTFNDITTRKQAEEAMFELSNYNRNLIKASLDPLVTINSAGYITDVNTATERATGYDRKELIGTNFANYFTDSQQAEAGYRRAFEQGTVRDYPLEIRHRDGHITSVIYNATVYRDKTNNIIGVFAAARDITELKQIEAEKDELEAQNRQLQKTESLGRMAAAIAHHFNNQLGVVIGNLEMAIDDQPKGAPSSKSLTAAMEAAWKSADMSNMMLTYLGQTHDKAEPLDLSHSCHKIIPLIKATLPGNIVMKTDFPLPRPIIMANSNAIQQILTNLTTNAQEAIGNNSGTISLSVKAVSPAEIPTAHLRPIGWQPQDKAYACLEVADTGCGIEDKDIEQLFDPFFSTKFAGSVTRPTKR